MLKILTKICIHGFGWIVSLVVVVIIILALGIKKFVVSFQGKRKENSR